MAIFHPTIGGTSDSSRRGGTRNIQYIPVVNPADSGTSSPLKVRGLRLDLAIPWAGLISGWTLSKNFVPRNGVNKDLIKSLKVIRYDSLSVTPASSKVSMS